VSAQNDAQHVKLADLVADGRAAPCQAPIEAAGQPGRTFPLRLRKVLAKAAIAASRNGRIAIVSACDFRDARKRVPTSLRTDRHHIRFTSRTAFS